MKTINNTLLKAFWVLFLGIISHTLWAQMYSISGQLVDEHDSIVPAASIILTNQKDSSFVEGTISNMDGHFILNKVKDGNYLLHVQHLLYEKKDIAVTNLNTDLKLGNIVLSEKENELNEISVKAIRPVVKMENNTLSYDATAVSEKFVRDNAYEVLGDVPGINLREGGIQLVGAAKLNVAINGKPTTLSIDQVLNMLKAMPNTNVEKVEVMYAPPAKYNVKGALINIILTKAEKNQLNGSVNAGVRQRRNTGALGGLNLQYAKDKWDVNLLYSYDYDHISQKDIFEINHTYKDTLYLIEQNMQIPNKIKAHQLQLSTAYRIDSAQTLSFSYSGNFTNDNSSPNKTYTTFSSVKGVSTELDTSFSESTETLHNLKLDYDLANKLTVGADYTYYNSPSENAYTSVIDDELMEYETTSEQTVNKWMLYANHSFSLWNSDFSYGANYSYSGNRNHYSYYDINNDSLKIDEAQSSKNEYNEAAASGFLSFAKQLNPHWSLDFTLKGEFDRMQKESGNTKTDVWNTFYWYPSFNASFIPGNEYKHIFQLALESFTNYPSYWEISPATWYSNQYMLVKGNPELKPSQTYTSNFTYIFKQKYVMMLSYKYENEMMTQIPFASSESFNTITRFENIDFDKELTAAFVLPFNIGQYINVNPTAIYLHQHLKNSGSEEQAFDRTSDLFVFQCNTAISLWKKQGLKGTISGHYYGRGIQGIYDFEPSYLVDCGISCNMLKNKAVLSLKANDIFNSSIPKLNINNNNQKSHYNLDQDTRMFTLNFRYNFGKEIKNKKIDVDDSRFKRM